MALFMFCLTAAAMMLGLKSVVQAGSTTIVRNCFYSNTKNDFCSIEKGSEPDCQFTAPQVACVREKHLRFFKKKGFSNYEVSAMVCRSGRGEIVLGSVEQLVKQRVEKYAPDVDTSKAKWCNETAKADKPKPVPAPSPPTPPPEDKTKGTEFAKQIESVTAAVEQKEVAEVLDTPYVDEYILVIEKCVQKQGGVTRVQGYFMDLDPKKYTGFKRMLITDCWNTFSEMHKDLVIQPISIVDYLVWRLTSSGSVYYYYNMMEKIIDVAVDVMPDNYLMNFKYNFFNGDLHADAAAKCIGTKPSSETEKPPTPAELAAKIKAHSAYFCDLYPKYYKENKEQLIRCVWHDLAVANDRQFIYPLAVVQVLFDQLGCPAVPLSWWSWFGRKDQFMQHVELVTDMANKFIPTDDFYYYHGMKRKS